MSIQAIRDLVSQAQAIDPTFVLQDPRTILFLIEQSSSVGCFPMAYPSLTPCHMLLLQLVIGGCLGITVDTIRRQGFCTVQSSNILLRTIPLRLWHPSSFFEILHESSSEVCWGTLDLAGWAIERYGESLPVWIKFWHWRAATNRSLDTLLLPLDPDAIDVLKCRNYIERNNTSLPPANVIFVESRQTSHDSFLTKYWRDHLSSDENSSNPLIILKRKDDNGSLGLWNYGFTCPSKEQVLGYFEEQRSPLKTVVIDPFEVSEKTVPLSSLRAIFDATDSTPKAVLTLELTRTELKDSIRVPKIVQDIDWNTQFGEQEGVPLNILRYFQGWHVDFLGTAQYFYLRKGVKIFLLMEPTEENMNLYQSYCQRKAPVESLLRRAKKLRLIEGETLFMPGGWIHAVYSPVEAVVVSGNFFATSNLAPQIRAIREYRDAGAKDDRVLNAIQLLILAASQLCGTTSSSTTGDADVPSQHRMDELLELLRSILRDGKWIYWRRHMQPAVKSKLSQILRVTSAEVTPE